MDNDLTQTLKKLIGAEIRSNTLLRDFVSLKVGGVADYFYVAKNISDLTLAVSTAYKLKLPYFVLGGGYNVLPSDSGFPGLVIKNESSNIVFSSESSTAIVDSGVHLGKLINLAAGRDLGGLEFLFGVPGTIGGAIHGNAGAFNHAIGDFVRSVTVLVPGESGIKILKCDQKWMNFSYRKSKLKSEAWDSSFKPVILTATVQLVQRRKDEILRLMQDHLSEKKRLQPLAEISAGSFFVNSDEGRGGAAGYMLDQSGAKNLRVGGAAFSKKHANFLINRKNASASDMRLLAEKAKELVKNKFDITLKEEVEYIGRWE